METKGESLQEVKYLARPVNGGRRVVAPAKKLRVLFLHGAGFNAEVMYQSMNATGWISSFADEIEWIFLDGLFTEPMELTQKREEFQKNFTDAPTQTDGPHLRWGVLDKLTDALLDVQTPTLQKLHEVAHEAYAAHFQQQTVDVSSNSEAWKAIVDYISDVLRDEGPVDGLAGISEGAAVAMALTAEHCMGKVNLGVNFHPKLLLTVAPAVATLEEHRYLYHSTAAVPQLDIPSLHIVGIDEIPAMVSAVDRALRGFSNARKLEVPGIHTIFDACHAREAVKELCDHLRASQVTLTP